MEDPLELLASADWIKDYDPLFELFDEEMRAGSVDDMLTPTTSEITHASSTPNAAATTATGSWSNGCCTIVQDPYSSNNYVDPLVDLNQHLYHYHYQSYYHQQQQQPQQPQQLLIHANNYHNQNQQQTATSAACKQQQTDELNVILGHDWGIPYLSEYNSPTESSSSAYSSAAPSPAATTSSKLSPSSSTTISSCGSNSTTTTVNHGVIYVPKYHIPINNIALVTPKVNDKITTTKNTTATKIIVQNYDISIQNNDSSSTRNFVETQATNNSSEGTDSNCDSALKKRRKKCMRLNKGISLLAQPAPSRQISKQLARLCITIEHSYASAEPLKSSPPQQQPQPPSVSDNDSVPKPKCDCHK